MNTIAHEIEEALKILPLDEEVKERYLFATQTFGETYQKKILEVLLYHLKKFVEAKKTLLHEFKHARHEYEIAIEKQENEESLQGIEANIDAL